MANEQQLLNTIESLRQIIANQTQEIEVLSAANNNIRDRYAIGALQALVAGQATHTPAEITQRVTEALAYADEAIALR